MQAQKLVRFITLVASAACLTAVRADDEAVDFNRDIKPILSNTCYRCHGPDPAERQGGGEHGLRFDIPEGAIADLGGYAAVVPGDADASALIERISSRDPDVVMPPPEGGEPLTEKQILLFRRWIDDGANYDRHWSYARPERAQPFPGGTDDLNAIRRAGAVENPIDAFVIRRLLSDTYTPAARADRFTLIRRASLDLTGLPPTIADVDAFAGDDRPDAYVRAVDRMMAGKAFGEHWSRMWLDLARYADSAGYADDPPRMIWAYRDYVIRAISSGRPFDEFTVEQIAGDLLENPTDEQLTATAFHRNTLTNSEGGTDDEEFRNVAIVDRVNTTLAVWMGSTIACAQCHTHKYDPITQEDYFRLFAVFNNTMDTDKKDENPTIELWSPLQLRRRELLEHQTEKLTAAMSTMTDALRAEMGVWESSLAQEPAWTTLIPSQVQSAAGMQLHAGENGIVLASTASGDAATAAVKDTYSVSIPLHPAAGSEGQLTAIQLRTLPDASLPAGGSGFGGGNFVLSGISAVINPPAAAPEQVRFVRIELPGDSKLLSLAEVQVLSSGNNIATAGKATQSSTDFSGPPELAIDGNTNGDYNAAKSTTHTKNENNPWWEVDLGQVMPVDQIVVWNRTDSNLQSRLDGYRLLLLDEERREVRRFEDRSGPKPSDTVDLSGARAIPFAAAVADYAQEQFPAAAVLNETVAGDKGWAIGGAIDQPHELTLIPKSPVKYAAGSVLTITVSQQSDFERHVLGRFQFASTATATVNEFAKMTADVRSALRQPVAARTPEQVTTVEQHWLSIAPSLQTLRGQLARAEKELADMKPETTVPVFRQLAEDQHRKTYIQIRGNYQSLDREVTEGVPSQLFPLPDGVQPDRLGIAKWLVHDDNPLTPRVLSNRYWEALFGVGIVRTSEEFGSQGDLPSHPQLLDWMATELVRSGWDTRHLLRAIATSATYQQDSSVSTELAAIDPDNRLLARGPRFRLSAEMVRDQALQIGGLLSDRMFGKPARPPQPSMGLTAAFGGSTDWKASEDEDRWRRGIYTEWRRSNPYPSMAAFDAPNREVCTVRRDRTNTPLQALVTLNDPVYVEAAQGLALQMLAHEGSVDDKVAYGFRLAVSRPPHPSEVARLAGLVQAAEAAYADDPEAAAKLLQMPLKYLTRDSNPTQLAAWTLVGNVLLNMDETLMKR